MANYSYFSGANVIIRVGGQPILEAAGISYQETDTQMPIYGYGSRYFDAVAPGQKLIRGSFVINFVRPDYLAYAIARGRDIEKAGVASYGANPTNVANILETSRSNRMSSPQKANSSIYQSSDETFKSMTEYADKRAIQNLGPEGWDSLSEQQKSEYRTLEAVNNIASSNYVQTAQNMRVLSSELQKNMPTSYIENTYGLSFENQMKTKAVKDVTLNTAFNIDVVFANKCVIKLLDCYITSRGAMIQIDESTIVEEYSFFARNLKTLRLDDSQYL